MDCIICAEPRKQFVKCSDCGTEICVGCIKTYLLTQLTPRCMQCNAVWSQLYLRKSLPLDWVDGEYKVHCKTILLDLEKSYMPTTMDSYQNYKHLKQAEQGFDDFNATQFPLISKYEEDLKNTRTFIKSLDKKKEKEIIKDYMDDCKILEKRISSLKSEKITLHTHLYHCRAIVHNTEINMEEKSVSVFIKPCGEPDCRGFLQKTGENLVCGICSTTYCKTCEVKTISSSTSLSAVPHQCKQEDIETCKLIQTSTKPCPKCGVRIQKSFACDHMFCTSCKSSFNWKTGKLIDHRRTTNPLFYQWLESRTDEARAVARQIQGEDRGDRVLTSIDDITMFHDFFVSFEPVDPEWQRFWHLTEKYMPLYRHIHIDQSSVRNNFDTVLRDIELKINDLGLQEYGPNINRLVRCKYLHGEIDQTTLSTLCMKQYKQLFYNNEMVALLQDVKNKCSTMIKDYLKQLKDAVWASPNFTKMPKLSTLRSAVRVQGKREEFPTFDFKQIYPVLETFNENIKDLSKLFGYTVCKYYFVIKNPDSFYVTYKHNQKV